MHSVYFTSDKNQSSETNPKKEKTAAPYFLAIQGSYTTLEIALFYGDTVLSYEKNTDKKASAELIPCINNFLKNNKLQVNDLSFVAVDQGPGAFTSLRVAIATVNGIAFAAGSSLIGVDGLDALAQELALHTPSTEYVAPLLNAFNGELYFGLYSNHANNLICIEKGYAKIEKVIELILQKAPSLSITFAGNGIEYCKEELQKNFHDRLLIVQGYQTASAQQIGIEALKKWKQNIEISSYLLPLYLKTQQFKPKYS